MNDQQVRDLLGKMAVVWPKADVEETTIALWAENLEKVRDPQRAEEAVQLLMEETPFWPHWSEFSKAFQRLREAERREEQVVTRAQQPTEPAQRLDASMLELSERIKPGPDCGRHAAEQFVEILCDAWGDEWCRRYAKEWTRKIATMDLEILGPVIDQVAAGAPLTTWKQFKAPYNAQLDRRTMAQYNGTFQ